MSRVLRSALVHVVLLLAAGAVTCCHGPRLLSQGRQEQDLLRRLRQSPPSLNPSPVISHPRPRCSRVLQPAHHHVTAVRLHAVQRLPAVHKPSLALCWRIASSTHQGGALQNSSWWPAVGPCRGSARACAGTPGLPSLGCPRRCLVALQLAPCCSQCPPLALAAKRPLPRSRCAGPITRARPSCAAPGFFLAGNATPP